MGNPPGSGFRNRTPRTPETGDEENGILSARSLTNKGP